MAAVRWQRVLKLVVWRGMPEKGAAWRWLPKQAALRGMHDEGFQGERHGAAWRRRHGKGCRSRRLGAALQSVAAVT